MPTETCLVNAVSQVTSGEGFEQSWNVPANALLSINAIVANVSPYYQTDVSDNPSPPASHQKDTGVTSTFLNIGFDVSAVPTGATITGLTLNVYRLQTAHDAGGDIFDNAIRLRLSGVNTGPNLADVVTAWPLAYATKSYAFVPGTSGLALMTGADLVNLTSIVGVDATGVYTLPYVDTGSPSAYVDRVTLDVEYESVLYLDNFDGGAGTNLASHVADTGQSYDLLTAAQSSPNFVLDGSGRCKRVGQTYNPPTTNTDAVYNVPLGFSIPATCVYASKVTVKGPACNDTEQSVLGGLFGRDFDSSTSNGPLTVHYRMQTRSWVVLCNNCARYPTGFEVFSYTDDFEDWATDTKRFDIAYTWNGAVALLDFYLDGVLIGTGPLVINNGNLETGVQPTGWTINMGTGGVVTVAADGNADTGLYAICCDATAGAGTTANVQFPGGSMTFGHSYRLRLRAKALTNGMTCNLNYVSADNRSLTTAYQTLEKSWTVAGGSSLFIGRGGNLSKIWFDNIELLNLTTGVYVCSPGFTNPYHTGGFGVIFQTDTMFGRNAGVRLAGLAIHTDAPGTNVFAAEGEYPDVVTSCDNFYRRNLRHTPYIRR